MAAYVIVEIDIHNPELYKEYTQLTPASVKEHHGKFVVRGGACQVLEGDWQPKRIVVLEFPSSKAANAWWHSEEYTRARQIRQRAAHTKMILVDGV